MLALCSCLFFFAPLRLGFSRYMGIPTISEDLLEQSRPATDGVLHLGGYSITLGRVLDPRPTYPEEGEGKRKKKRDKKGPKKEAPLEERKVHYAQRAGCLLISLSGRKFRLALRKGRCRCCFRGLERRAGGFVGDSTWYVTICQKTKERKKKKTAVVLSLLN